MKSIKHHLFAIILIILMVNSCKKDEKEKTTSLEIRIIDQYGMSVSGVSIKLYKSETDLGEQQNQVGSALTTNANGEVTFNNLDPVKYYWFAEKDCNNNVNGIYTTDALQSNETTVITTTVIETGSLELTNESSYQFDVFINGYYLGTADPFYVYSYIYVPAGDYSISVIQVGGSIEKTYTGAIACGSKLSISFPD